MSSGATEDAVRSVKRAASSSRGWWRRDALAETVDFTGNPYAREFGY
jgi:hypothetical protein